MTYKQVDTVDRETDIEGRKTRRKGTVLDTEDMRNRKARTEIGV